MRLKSTSDGPSFAHHSSAPPSRPHNPLHHCSRAPHAFPQNGLYSAYTAPFAYALFGSSPQVVTGPTTVLSVVTANVLTSIHSWGGVKLVAGSALYTQVSSLLALMTGLQLLGLAFFGGAALASLVSTPVVVGFTSGSAIIIGMSQVFGGGSTWLVIAA